MECAVSASCGKWFHMETELGTKMIERHWCVQRIKVMLAEMGDEYIRGKQKWPCIIL